MEEIKRISTKEVKRIPPLEVKARVNAGEALFVCAYDDEEKCRQLRLEGAISLKELEPRLPSLSESQEIIFYCA